MININFVPYQKFTGSILYSKPKLQQLVSASISSGGHLDKNSIASRFFGVDSRFNIQKKLENQVNLALLKSKTSGILPTFPKRACFSVDRPNTIYNSWNHIWTVCKGRKFEELLTKPARLTFNGKFFGKNGAEDSHTIGIVYDKKSKTLYCLDSLSNLCKEVQEYQDILRNQIFNSPNGEIKRIIFSNKPQQNLNEYTCNNWAIANIEALQKALKEGKNIDSTEQLNAVLPDDINVILQEQYEYMLKNNINSKLYIQRFY